MLRGSLSRTCRERGQVVVFFALLLLAFFGISLLVGAIGRQTSRGKRVTTDEL